MGIAKDGICLVVRTNLLAQTNSRSGYRDKLKLSDSEIILAKERTIEWKEDERMVDDFLCSMVEPAVRVKFQRVFAPIIRIAMHQQNDIHDSSVGSVTKSETDGL